MSKTGAGITSAKIWKDQNGESFRAESTTSLRNIIAAMHGMSRPVGRGKKHADGTYEFLGHRCVLVRA